MVHHLKTLIKPWLKDFKTYLKSKPSTKTKKAPFNQYQIQSSYFNKVRAALKEAVREGILQTNPGKWWKASGQDDPDREFLTLEELQASQNGV